MKNNFEITIKKSRGNLHLRLAGDLTVVAALKTLGSIGAHDDREGRIFLDTRALARITAPGRHLLRLGLGWKNLSAERLFFKGEKGFSVAPSGCRVLVQPLTRCRCCSMKNLGCSGMMPET